MRFSAHLHIGENSQRFAVCGISLNACTAKEWASIVNSAGTYLSLSSGKNNRCERQLNSHGFTLWRLFAFSWLFITISGKPEFEFDAVFPAFGFLNRNLRMRIHSIRKFVMIFWFSSLKMWWKFREFRTNYRHYSLNGKYSCRNHSSSGDYSSSKLRVNVTSRNEIRWIR